MRETWVQSLGWEDPLEKGKATRLQYSGLENSMNCIVHGVANSQTGLSNFHTFTFPIVWEVSIDIFSISLKFFSHSCPVCQRVHQRYFSFLLQCFSFLELSFASQNFFPAYIIHLFLHAVFFNETENMSVKTVAIIKQKCSLATWMNEEVRNVMSLRVNEWSNSAWWLIW